MTLKEARKICEEIIQKYGIKFCDYKEEKREGKVKLVSLTVRFWINEKKIDFLNESAKIDSKT